MTTTSTQRVRRSITAIATVAGLAMTPAPAAAQDTVTTPEPARRVGHTASTLAADGHPVISYYDAVATALVVMRCDDPACAGEETSTVVDADGHVGENPSIVLDGAGNPVIAYDDRTEGVQVLHCDDPFCAGDERPRTIADDPSGFDPSVVLDAAGNPVVSFTSFSKGLGVLHCDDPFCDGREVPRYPAVTGQFPSMVLDARGNPVISYRRYTDRNLMVLHCDDPACAPSVDEVPARDDVPARIDDDGDGGYDTSIALDADGHPVVSAYSQARGRLVVAHCDDPLCAGDEASRIETPDPTEGAGRHTSLELGADGNPVISYEGGRGELRVLHCDDPRCAGVEEPVRVDVDINVGHSTSLALDGAGHPVVTYIGGQTYELRVLHCDDPACDPALPPPPSASSASSASSAAATHR